MAWYNNVKILTKIMLLVLFMSALSLAIGGIGLHSLMTFDKMVDTMEESAREALTASSLKENVMLIEQYEQELVIEPSQKTVKSIKEDLVKEKAQFEERVSELKKTADEKQVAQLDNIKNTFETYLKAQEEVFSVASSVQDFQLSEQQAKVKEAEGKDDDEAQALHKSVFDYIDADSTLKCNRIAGSWL